ncbi:peptidoglycan DD-metalloendopeptidase family protein [uncultured Prevotella sp.]|uniref:peptidoglycan DD-metalloendopeptidase family protein n=1 Tax=uncultured Prevotella sp. TaxID=159272 RepID=UPI0027E2E721|nr:peptidoglycan DD-metalloendopeptidase family protein [uncultured Prevotella sp.]
MNLKKTIKKLAISALLAVAAIPVHGQDLLARQAPVDRKMAAVDTIMLRNITIKEDMESPASELYANWDNRYAHRATKLPETYRIDLRHFCMPTTSRVITSNFGSRWGGQHKGLDIKVYIGDTIRSAFSGKVRIVRYEGGGYGKYIVIRHNNGLETIYGHLSKQLVKENQEVRAGEVIGLGGNTGRSTGSHLHFETRLCGVALNPALMFDFREQDVTGDYYAFNKATYDSESITATRLRGKQDGSTIARENKAEDFATNDRMTSGLKDQVQYHKVVKGETLDAIAKKRGVTIDKICKLNHISKTKRLRPGQILRYS